MSCMKSTRDASPPDMMAYEYFRQLHKRPLNMRVPLERFRSTANYAEGFLGEDTFLRMRYDIENVNCGTDTPCSGSLQTSFGLRFNNDLPALGARKGPQAK
jgi:hypothetical protein